MNKITVWKLFNQSTFVHNHIEEGHSESTFPLPIHPSFVAQKSWKSYKWEKVHAHLENGKVIE